MARSAARIAPRSRRRGPPSFATPTSREGREVGDFVPIFCLGSEPGHRAFSHVRAGAETKSGVWGKWGDIGVTGVQTCALPIWMGNPDAPVKLVEYGSLSCPHCAEFEEQGAPELRDTYIKSGQVSWEFRTYLLFGLDAGISALLHCQGEG